MLLPPEGLLQRQGLTLQNGGGCVWSEILPSALGSNQKKTKTNQRSIFPQRFLLLLFLFLAPSLSLYLHHLCSMFTIWWLLFFFLPPSLSHSWGSSFLSILWFHPHICLRERHLLFSPWHGIKCSNWVSLLIKAAVQWVWKACLPRAALVNAHCELMSGLQKGEVTGRDRGLGKGKGEQTVDWCYSYTSQKSRESPFGKH